METYDSIIDILTTQETNLFEHKGKFIDLHHTKRTSWNNRRNYGA